MKRVWVVALAGVALVAGVWAAQPPDGPPRKEDGQSKEGPPRKGRGPGGQGGGPPRFELGRILPPWAIEVLDLSPAQREQIEQIEREVKQRLMRILTDEQRRKLENFRRMGPGGPGGPGGKGPPFGPPPDKGDGGPPDKGFGGSPPDREPETEPAPGSAGIQWFSTWESGLRLARRSGRPILLVSAAPHCAGVSGMW